MFRIVRWRSLYRRSTFEREMADEFAFHMDARTQDLIRSGLGPEEAARRARLEFGARERFRAECRESHRVSWLEEAEQSIRFALRNLRQTPVSASISILALALGLAAVGVMFAVVSTVLLRRLPFADSQRIVVISQKVPFLSSSPTVVTAEEFQSWERSGVFESAALLDATEATLDNRDRPERIYGAQVTPDFFRVFKLQPVLGRGFSRDDINGESSNVIVLSHQLWARCFGSDRNIIGKAVRMSGIPKVVIGVMPARFDFPKLADVSSIMNWAPQQTEFWTLFVITPKILEQGNFNYYALGRLRAGVTSKQAAARFLPAAARLFREKQLKYPEYKNVIEQMLGVFAIYVTPLQETMTSGLRDSLWMLLAAVSVLLILVLFNLGSFLLTRNAQRSREFAVRQALGANRWQLFRQSLFEQLVSVGLASGLAFALAWIGISLVRTVAASRVPRLYELGFSFLDFALLPALALIAALVFGSLSQLLIRKAVLGSELKSHSRNATSDRGSTRLRFSLVVAEIAVCTVLLVVAGLLLQSFNNVMREQPGFNPQNVLTVEVPFAYTSGDKPEKRVQHIRELIGRLRALPGVQAVSVANRLPLAGDNEIHTIHALGKPMPRSAEGVGAEYRVVDAGFFRTMQIPVLSGRTFRENDPASFAVISRKMAKHLWPDADPIGKQFTDGEPLQVIGVVGDVHYASLEKPPMMQFYRLITADPYYADIFIIRAARGAESLIPSVQKTVWQLNASEPVTHVQTLHGLMHSVTLQRRFMTSLLSAFAGVALFLSALGLFSVASLSVAQRAREFGIRLAMGATRSQILRLELSRTSTLALLGLAAGLVMSVLVTRALGGLLYGVLPWEPRIFGLAAVVLVGSASLAAWLPAHRAASIDPAATLRSE